MGHGIKIPSVNVMKLILWAWRKISWMFIQHEICVGTVSWLVSNQYDLNWPSGELSLSLEST